MMAKVPEYYFPEIYGEDEREELTSAGEAQVKIEDFADSEFSRSVQIDNYWTAFQTFLDAVGDFSWTVKLEHNSNNRGIYLTQVVKYDYYKGQRYGGGTVEANFQQSKEDRRNAVWSAAHDLNYWSRLVGLRQMNEDEIRGLVNYLIGRVNTENGPDTGRRRKQYFRNNVKRLRARGELQSVNDILERCVALEE